MVQLQTKMNLAQHTPCGLLIKEERNICKNKKKKKKKRTCRLESIVPFETELRQIVNSNRTPK